MTAFIAPDITNYIKQLETKKLEGLYELFTKLEYSFVDFNDQEINFDSWDIKDSDQTPIQDHILDLRRIAYYKDFWIIYCQIDRFTKFLERKIGKKLIEDYKYCLIIFTDSKNTEWHFVNIRWDEKNEKRNLFRRLVIDEYDKIYTANERLGLISLIDKMGSVREPENAELMHIHDEAFDVEAVTAQFFQIYKSILTSIRNTFSDQKKTNEKECHEASQLLLNRLMFLYFIQKKNWLNNNRNFLFGLYNYYIKNKSIKSNFYSDYLKPLFFESFNDKHNYGKYPIPEDIIVDYSNMPYLNGGLFEETELDLLDFLIPDQLMDNIFTNLLEKYNFTIREDSPIDQEIAIDPEMLGKVYESLLLEEERGESGIFYTPRIEIDFMCKQSLFHYLKPKFEDHSEDLIQILYNPDFTPKNSKWLNSLKDILENITVADPACGSGSFLVGMLNVLYDVLRKIYFSLEMNIDQFKILKRIIFTSLYGVDIKNWAIEVAKLRLWLRLIINIEISDLVKKEPILPNFFYKLRQGDSLIQRLGSNYFLLPSNFGKRDFYEGEQLELLKKIVDLKKNYFFHSVSKSIDEINKEISESSNKLYEYLIKIKISSYEEEIKKLSVTQKSIESFTSSKKKNTKKEENLKISEYKKEISILQKILNDLQCKLLKTIFLWELDFVEVFIDEGFDIIIGNPPYLRQEEIKPIDTEDKEIIKKYKDKLIEFSNRKWGNKLYPGFSIKIDRKSDYLIYFYYFGLSYLKKEGIFCFITSNSWLDVQYGYPFQEFLLKNIQIIEIIDNLKQRSFKQAEINTIISIFKKPSRKTPDFNQIVKFIAFKQNYEIIINANIFLNINSLIQKDSNENFNLRCFSQKDLYLSGIEKEQGEKQKTLISSPLIAGKYKGNKWGNFYLKAPFIFDTLLEKYQEKLISLKFISKIKFGIKTGANDYFLLKIIEEKSKSNRKYVENGYGYKFEIDDDFLIPFVKSPKEIINPIINPKNLKYHLLWIQKPLKTSVEEYINWGENKEIEIKQGKQKGQKITGINHLSTVSNRKIWYKLNPEFGSTIIFQKIYNDTYKIGFSRDKTKFICDNTFYEVNIRPEYEKYTELISALLLSTWTILNIELNGRANFGGGALDIKVYEVNNIKMLNPSLIPTDISKQIINVFSKIKNQIYLPLEQELKRKERYELDKIIFNYLGLNENDLKEFYEELKTLVYNRINKSKSLEKR